MTRILTIALLIAGVAHAQPGEVFEFDGSTGVAYKDSFSQGTGNFAVSFWVKPDDASVSQYMAINADDLATASDKFSWRIVTGASGGITFSVSSDGLYANRTEVITTNSLVVGQWTHVVCMSDGSNISITIDTETMSSVAYTDGVYEGTGKLVYGARYDLSEGIFKFFFDGTIATPRVFNRALPADEITAMYRQGPHGDTQDYYQWDQGDRYTDLDTIPDLTGNGNDGANSGSVLGSDVGGIYRTFAGAEYIDIGTLLDGVDDYTLLAWAKYTDTNTFQAIMGFNENGATAEENIVVLYANSGGDNGGFTDERHNVLVGTSTTRDWTNTNWNCYAGTAERNGDLKFFVNGVQRGATASGVGNIPVDDNFGTYLGARNVEGTMGAGWGGELAYIAVWERALATNELATVASYGQFTDSLQHGVTSGLVAEWDMGGTPSTSLVSAPATYTPINEAITSMIDLADPSASISVSGTVIRAQDMLRQPPEQAQGVDHPYFPIYWNTFDTGLNSPRVGPQLSVTNNGGTISWTNGYMQVASPANNQGAALADVDEGLIDVDKYNAFTVTGWYDPGGYCQLYSSGYHQGEFVGTMMANANAMFTSIGGNWSDSLGTGFSGWVFFAISVDLSESTYTAWKNSSKYTFSTPGTYVKSTQIPVIGAYYYVRTGTHLFDDVRIFDKALPETEVDKIRLEGRQ